MMHVASVEDASSPHQEAACRFPKLEECAHFHYERVQLPAHVQVTLQTSMEQSLRAQHSHDEGEWYMVQVTSGDECWLLQRTLENFHMLDSQLHQCIYDRKVSQLPDLANGGDGGGVEMLVAYLQRLSGLADNSINCGPVLNWLQMDNRGHRLLVPSEESRSINTPAVAAAYSVRRYVSQARDELSLEVGDMISVIDMAAPGESLWWRGKRGFQVGFFPQHCVHIIGDKVPRHMPLPPPVVGAIPAPGGPSASPLKPVLRTHGKLIAFFRSFLLHRPSRRRLKQSGILRERVFGCDLGEHLLNTGCDVPMVLRCCAAFIEAQGIVHGIYRLSGATSNIQKLRNAFDEDRVPDLRTPDILQDIHSVASLLKMYFRELPNPLCTHQLYQRFVAAVHGCTSTRSAHHDHARLLRMRDAVQKLPPPHYRTLEHLARHLATVATHAERTGMTVRNVAIVWAPNLLRCADLEFGGGVAALQGVGVQAVVTEFLIAYADLIFCDNLSVRLEAVSTASPQRVRRPKSLAISTPTRLITLEEARNKQLSKDTAGYIEVGGGPESLPKQYHTVIELPLRKRANSKRSPIGWRSLFGRSRKPVVVVQHPQQSIPSPSEPAAAATTCVLRSVKSVESLKSLGDLDQLPPLLENALSAKPVGHNRSVSHDSYFDTLPTENNHIDVSLLDIAEIQVNFALEEAEMRIFSEDESLVSSPRVQPRRVRAASGGGGGDPSPKKQPRRVLLSPEAASRKRTRLEEQLGELQFIDCSTPEMGARSAVAQVHVDAEPRQKSPRSSRCLVDPLMMMSTSTVTDASPPSSSSPTYKLLESSVASTPGDDTSPTKMYENVLTTISITYKSPTKTVCTEDAQIPTSTASLPLQAAKLQQLDDDEEKVEDEEEPDAFPACDTTLSELIDSYDRIAKATSGDWSQVVGDDVHDYENVHFNADDADLIEFSPLREHIAPPGGVEVNQEKRKSSSNLDGCDVEDVYQQVKYFRRSVHEINELLDLAAPGEVEATEKVSTPAPCDSLDVVQSACESIEFVGDSLEATPGAHVTSLSVGVMGDDENAAISVKRLTTKFETKTQLPPCVRSRNCKSTLKPTRSLDESEFTQVVVDDDDDCHLQRRRKSMDEVNLSGCKTSTLPKSLNQPKALPEDVDLQQHVVPHNDVVSLNRDRIEKYKEERRKFLHDKYRSESFKEDKDVLLSRFKAFKPPPMEAPDANGVRARTALFEGDVQLRRAHHVKVTATRRSLDQPPPSSPQRKEKLTASYCIKDMKALFESKSSQQ